MSNPLTQQIDNVGTQPIPNDSIMHGIINNEYVTGVTTVSWNARSGGISKIVFKGTEYQLTQLANMARNGGYEYDLSGGHIWTLNITFPFDIILDGDSGETNPLFTWELINTPFEKDILELGDRKFNNKMSADTVKAIDNKLNNPNNGQYPFDIQAANNGYAAVNATVAYRLKSIGVHGEQTSLPTIRKTMIVSNFLSPSSELIYPELDWKIFSTKQFLNQYHYANYNGNRLNQIPQIMKDALPTSMTVNQWFNNDQSQKYISDDNFSENNYPHTWNMDGKGIVTYIGWLQFPSEYQMVSVNKIQITQHWVWNQWSAGDWGLYDPVDGSGDSPNPNDVLMLII
jgi:hypothetical protein